MSLPIDPNEILSRPPLTPEEIEHARRSAAAWTRLEAKRAKIAADKAARMEVEITPTPLTVPVAENAPASAKPTTDLEDDDLFLPRKTQRPILDYALDAVRRGLFVAPLKPRSKQPATEHGVLDATNDESKVRAWWAENCNYNYLIALGPSNIVVWDFDKVHPFDGMPATMIVKTGRTEENGISGLQYYYRGSASTHSLRADGKRVLRSNEPGYVKDDPANRPVGERRGRGAYVVGYGSVHPSGNRYEIIADVPLAPSPEQDEAKPVISGPAIDSAKLQDAVDVIENALTQADIEFEDSYSGAGGEIKWRIACPWEAEHTGGKRFDSSSTVILWPNGKIIYSCKHAHCDGVRKWNEPDATRDANQYLRHFIEDKIGQSVSFGGEVFIGSSAETAKSCVFSVNMEEPAEPTADEIKEIEPEEDFGIDPAQCDMPIEEFKTEYDNQYPVFQLKKKPGPAWTDDIFYGPAGEIIKLANEYNEAHPAGMLLDFLATVGIIFGRNAYFNISQTRHYTNEYIARVGDSSTSRKGSGRDTINELCEILDLSFSSRILSGFGSPEAIISSVRDEFEQQRLDKKKNSFITTKVPGVKDKRLMIREAELASIFVLASKPDSRADVILRDGWDSKPLRNVVKGNTDGINNSAVCLEPMIGISGDTTRHELVAKMPRGADENGFGNRFLYCYVYRTKLCPLGGPQIDWLQSDAVMQLFDAISLARTRRYIPLTAAAEKAWARMYLKMESNPLPGMAGKMTSRGPAHVRRLALIYALLDKCDTVEPRHLYAAKKLWDYCAESALFIFNNYTKDQLEILDFIERKRTTNLTEIREELHQRHKLAAWITEQVNHLIRGGYVKKDGDAITFKKRE